MLWDLAVSNLQNLQKIKFTSYKRCKFIVKSVKITQETHFKKIVSISKNIIKEKSCVICLTERTFIHEIEEKYALKSKLKVYPKFFTD